MPISESAVRIDVVVPVYNKLKFLDKAVGSVADAVDAHGATRLWLVDNGSTDGSYEFLVKRFAPRANLLRVPSGTISAVRNLGAKEGSAPIISFIDCDCLLASDYFTQIETAFAETGAEATGCKVVLPLNPSWVESVWNRMHDDGSEGLREWINSANFAIRRSVFEQIGGFDETLETGEDAEICQRIRRIGGRLVEDRRLAVAHLDNAKTLTVFFRKERWRGLGMLGTVSTHSLDKPTAMTVIHLLALSAAIGVMSFAPMSVLSRVGLGLALAFVAPVVTVAYRRRSSVVRFDSLRGVVLYQLYYVARINALAMICVRGLRGER
jgi:cellulose synthase/poly-beta-1,6-N-acetylglucosamine synthase-like glycosyltransferase